jgi:maltooligosyltrehalose trehalohydrolase
MSVTRPVRRMHAMPFGTVLPAAGGTEFRLWAPDAGAVDLCLGAGAAAERVLPLAPDDGWWRLHTDVAGPGALYRFRIDGKLLVPDPASRAQHRDVHGPSRVEDPSAFAWEDVDWRGRPWHEAALYELHVGAFTPAGTFAGVRERLDALVDLGVTGIQLMPIAAFAGRRGWGYDGVLPFAPAADYGPPAALKALVQAAHARGLMVLLDVVYNHLGPDGNYLHAYARRFFAERDTPWGAAPDFTGSYGTIARAFVVHNALYWLEEFHLDGLRLDAVHAIPEPGRRLVLGELARAVRAGPGARRHVHLVLENDANEATLLRAGPEAYDAQWDDDPHHALHVLLTGECSGYYGDFADRPTAHLGRALAEGFAWQGEPSSYRRGRPRGEPSAHLPATAFVTYLQTHDQIGNRLLGDRLASSVDPRALRAALTVVLLGPQIPMLFMGEEVGATTPFPFFCDFDAERGAAVAAGRRRDLALYPGFGDPAIRGRMPDPNAEATFASAVLRWERLEGAAGAMDWRAWVRGALATRRREIAPRLAGLHGGGARWERLGPRALTVSWTLGDGSVLALLANLGEATVSGIARPSGRPIFASDPDAASAPDRGELAAWSALWLLEGAMDFEPTLPEGDAASPAG